MSTLPNGTVTFLFTDIEGSTRLWETHKGRMPAVVLRHRELVRDAIECHHGTIFGEPGDGFCASFQRAPDALKAAIEAQIAIADELWPPGSDIRVRMGIDAGTIDATGRNYFGRLPNRTARLMAAGYGGQILLSERAHLLIDGDLPEDVEVVTMGPHYLRYLQGPMTVFQVNAPGLRHNFPPLKSLGYIPNNLPRSLSSFVGRADNLDSLARQLRARSIQLITLTECDGRCHDAGGA